MVNPQGVQGRMNMGQLLDTAAGKLALKKGEPIEVKNFEGEDVDVAKKIYDELEKEGIPADEILTDGKGGKPLKNPVFVGNRQYIKLRHLVKKKQNAHSYGTYDINEQPGGKAQKIGKLDSYALLAHGSKNLLREVSTIKGRKNEEYMRDLQMGIPPGKPAGNFAFDKMLNYMQASGVDVKKEGNKFQLLPLTDKRVEELSKGALSDPGAMLIGKNLASRKGGLFDKKITGGPTGENYSHIDLPTRLPNPMAEVAIKSILDLTNKNYDAVMKGNEELDGKKGPEAILSALENIDVEKALEETKAELKDAPASKVNKLNTKVRTLDALHKEGLNAKDAYTMSKALVIPPKFRRVYPLPSGDLQVSDINKHYRDVGLQAKGLKEALDEDILTEEDEIDYSNSLYRSVKAMQGFVDPITYGKQKYKGALKDLGHTKKGIIFADAWEKRQDLTGRSTITPEPSLGLDSVGIPEEIAKAVYKPFMVKNLKESGMPAGKALKEVKDHTPRAKKAMEDVMRAKPVLLNRAPTLHKHGFQAFQPQLTEGKEIRLNPLVVGGYNADFDGDEQINSVVVFILDKDLESYYLSHSQYNKQFWKDREIMASRLNVKLPYAKDGKFYLVNLEDFPYKKDRLLGQKDHIDFYAAEDYINVIAYDEVNNKLVLAKAEGWSYHKQREIWTVDLSDKSQIITDDDPRAVYGIDPQTLQMVRKTPENSKGLLVPKSDYAANLDVGMKKLSVVGTGKLKPEIKLNKEVGYVLGSLAGDGWVDIIKGKPNRVNLSGIEEDCFYKYREALSHVFKKTPHIGHRINEDSYGQSEKRIISSVDFAEWVLPLIGKGAKNKHLPPFWFTATDEFKWGLFSGLLDTDGSVSVNRSKKTPQLQANISSISIRLLQETQQMLRTLGIRSRISFSKKTQADNDFWILSISSPDLAKHRDKLFTAHEKNIEALGTYVQQDSKSAMRNDYVPFNQEIRKYVNSTEKSFHSKHRSLYVTMTRDVKKGRITRFTAKKILDLPNVDQSKLPKAWIDIINNDDVTWVSVEKVTNTGKKEDGYDLTVPGYETFMSVDGIILSNTMSVHVPVTYEGEEEARGMFPSKILFKHGDKGLVPSISQEYMYGVSKLSELGKKTGKKFDNINEAKEAGLDMTDVFTLNGKKMTIGQYELNEVLPEKHRDYSRVFKGKKLDQLMDKVARDEDSDVFKDMINRYKDLGALYAYQHGGTVSIKDMVLDRSYRDDLLDKYRPRIEKIKDPDKKTQAWSALVDKMEEAQNEKIKDGNRMWELIDTGALSKTKAGNVRQVLTAPGVVADTRGKPVPFPVMKSYSEGLGTFDYFNTLPGVRKGIVDKSVNTQESGALTNALLAVNRRLLITDEDCETKEGLELDIDDSSIRDRLLLETVRGVGKRNDVVDMGVISRAQAKKMETIKVRSALTCESVQGVCQKCYGLLPGGDLPDIGDNVGILDSEALTERSTQLTMSTFHTGGAVGKDGGSSFPRLEQLIKVPQQISGKATLSPVKGKVTSLKKNAIGGWDVKVNNHSLTISPGLEPVVKEGNNVDKGDRLSSGVIKPQELGDLKSHLDAQRYIVDEISSIYGDGFQKKSIETVLRGISDNAVVTEADDDSGYYRGDKTSMSLLKGLNREREHSGLKPIKFDPYFKSIDTLNVDNEDWMTKITTNRVKDGLAKGMAKAQWADIAGKDPIPAYLWGDDFGQPQKKRDDGEGFY